MIKTLLTFLGFQVVWFACAFGAAQEIWYLPSLASVIYLGAILGTSSDRVGMLYVIIASLIIGFLVDSLLLQLHLVSFLSTNPLPFDTLQPWWMAMLWACFGASFPSSFAWLKNRNFLSATLGAIFGPIAYYSGTKLGAIAPISQLGLVFVGVLWLMTMPLMVRLSFQFIKFHQPELIVKE